MEDIRKIYISGHRNPDVDSIAAAAALAILRARHTPEPVQAICPGIIPEKAKYLFEKFNVPLPPSITDIHLRIEDIMESNVPMIPVGTPLLEAVEKLRTSGYSRLPVVSKDKTFLGMLSPLNLLSHLLDISHNSGNSLTSRQIHSSLALIAKVIQAKYVTVHDENNVRDFKVYVAAMGIDSFDSHLPAGDGSNLVIICGDRPEIHLRALQRKVGILILTGDRQLEPLILREAKNQGISILQTSLDSASVIRNLKFSSPVEYFGFQDARALVLSPHERVHGLENRILNAPEDVLPVLDDAGKFCGAILKRAVSAMPPFRLIMVDHNEQEQSIPGAREIPVIEVVDHHRIGMMPTTMPIRFTGDVVGSTCTLVASMFKTAGESLPAGIAGILLGGLVTDTLMLKSPTTSPLDIRVCEWLEKLCGVTGRELLEELSKIDSPLASKNPEDVINSDRKSYTDGKYRFSLSQVEETNLELLHQRREELQKALHHILVAEGLNFIGLMVTDAVRETSELLYCGSELVRRELPFSIGNPDGDLLLLPGILSRKKQLLPRILAITTQLSR